MVNGTLPSTLHLGQPCSMSTPEDISRAGALAPRERECARTFSARAALALMAGKCKAALEIRKQVYLQ